jgi:hypothetical protein
MISWIVRGLLVASSILAGWFVAQFAGVGQRS